MDKRPGASQTTEYPAEKARGGVIILQRPWQRVVFIAGLAGAVLLLLYAILLPGSLH